MGCEIDFETRGVPDLRAVGQYVYFDHPDTSARMASYSFDHGATVRRWRFGAPCPADLRAHLERGAAIARRFRDSPARLHAELEANGAYTEAHNAAFEFGCFGILADGHGWPRVELEQLRCTAAMAASMGLPRGLDDLAAALGLAQRKDKDGYRLMLKLSRPASLAPLTWHDDPADVDREHDYCDQDVRTEAAARKRLIPLVADEQRLWVLDQRINGRGWRFDARSARACLRLVERAKDEANAGLRDLTGGRVETVDQVGELKGWLADACGVDMPSLGKQEVTDTLADLRLDPFAAPAAVQALELRQQAAKSSLAKLPTMLRRRSADDRLRGCFLYHGTAPGRWVSLGAQVQNIPRVRKVFEDAHPDVNGIMAALRHGDPDLLRWLYGDDLGQPLALLADMMRSFLWAAPGHDLVVADYSNMQGRVAAWLGGEQWKLDAFVAADEKRGPGLYELTAAKIYGVDVELVSKLQRQTGKVAELALQFNGGVFAFYSMGRGYGLKLEPVHDTIWQSADDEAREWVVKRYDASVKQGQSTTKLLSREAWIAADLVKAGWRRQHPGITNQWVAMKDAMFAAVERPGTIAKVGAVSYLTKGGFLWCRLPSGRVLAYGAPRIQDVEVPWADQTVPAKERERQPAVTVATVSGEKGMTRYPLTGGIAFQNVVMSVERDILVLGMHAVEAAGYPLVGHVHDELIAEVPRGFGSVAEFAGLMAQRPAWSAGLPVVAAGWRGKRYRKV